MDPRLQAGVELQLEKKAQQEHDSSLSGVLGQYFKQAAEPLEVVNGQAEDGLDLGRLRTVPPELLDTYTDLGISLQGQKAQPGTAKYLKAQIEAARKKMSPEAAASDRYHRGEFPGGFQQYIEEA